jgi:hypothetical protein
MLNSLGLRRRAISFSAAVAGLVLAAGVNVISAPLASAASAAPVSHARCLRRPSTPTRISPH